MEDEMLHGFILDSYGADEVLRKKVELKYDMSVIAGPHFGVTLWGEAYVVEKWIPIIRKIILKYEEE